MHNRQLNDHISTAHPGHHMTYLGRNSISYWMASTVEHPNFQRFITIVIILAGVVVGVETYESFASEHSGLLTIINDIILWIFVAEIIMKMVGQGRHFLKFFNDPWNIFDFIIVSACFLPIGQEYALVLRLIRLLRVLKLVTALPKLQILVSALLKSIPSMAYVSILLFLLFYIYGCAAVFLFGENDPLLFGDLHTALLTLFRVVTLEDWTDVMYTAMYGCSNYELAIHQELLCTSSKAQPIIGAIFFVSFVLFGTMIALNLFIGVIMKGMDEASLELKVEEAFQAQFNDDPLEIAIHDQILELQQQLQQSQESLEKLAITVLKLENE